MKNFEPKIENGQNEQPVETKAQDKLQEQNPVHKDTKSTNKAPPACYFDIKELIQNLKKSK